MYIYIYIYAELRGGQKYLVKFFKLRTRRRGRINQRLRIRLTFS